MTADNSTLIVAESYAKKIPRLTSLLVATCETAGFGSTLTVASLTVFLLVLKRRGLLTVALRPLYTRCPGDAPTGRKTQVISGEWLH